MLPDYLHEIYEKLVPSWKIKESRQLDERTSLVDQRHRETFPSKSDDLASTMSCMEHQNPHDRARAQRVHQNWTYIIEFLSVIIFDMICTLLWVSKWVYKNWGMTARIHYYKPKVSIFDCIVSLLILNGGGYGRYIKQYTIFFFLDSNYCLGWQTSTP